VYDEEKVIKRYCYVCTEEREQLSVLFCLLAFLRITGLVTVAALCLDVFIVDGESFINLCPESRVILNSAIQLVTITKVKTARFLQIDQLCIVHFQKHTGNLACQFWLHNLNLGKQSLSEKLLLLLWGHT
jgi:hypothetical protein